jgi:hypothetical protein
VLNRFFSSIPAKDYSFFKSAIFHFTIESVFTEPVLENEQPYTKDTADVNKFIFYVKAKLRREITYCGLHEIMYWFPIKHNSAYKVSDDLVDLCYSIICVMSYEYSKKVNHHGYTRLNGIMYLHRIFNVIHKCLQYIYYGSSYSYVRQFAFSIIVKAYTILFKLSSISDFICIERIKLPTFIMRYYFISQIPFKPLKGFKDLFEDSTYTNFFNTSKQIKLNIRGGDDSLTCITQVFDDLKNKVNNNAWSVYGQEDDPFIWRNKFIEFSNSNEFTPLEYKEVLIAYSDEQETASSGSNSWIEIIKRT